MTYYIYIQDEKLNGCGQCRQLTERITNLEVDESLYNAFVESPDMYIWNGYDVVINPNHEDEKLKQAQTAKLQEASDKAFEYRNVTGLVSFNARPVDTSLLAEGESTLVLHTELLNQNDFFQRMVGFNSGLFTDDVVYNTKEDILIYLNAEETQAIYYAIVDRAGRLWNEDYMVYKALIEGCNTAEEVEQIVIDYDNVPAIEGKDTSIIKDNNTIMEGGE